MFNCLLATDKDSHDLINWCVLASYSETFLVVLLGILEPKLLDEIPNPHTPNKCVFDESLDKNTLPPAK